MTKHIEIWEENEYDLDEDISEISLVQLPKYADVQDSKFKDDFRISVRKPHKEETVYSKCKESLSEDDKDSPSPRFNFNGIDGKSVVLIGSSQFDKISQNKWKRKYFRKMKDSSSITTKWSEVSKIVRRESSSCLLVQIK